MGVLGSVGQEEGRIMYRERHVVTVYGKAGHRVEYRGNKRRS